MRQLSGLADIVNSAYSHSYNLLNSIAGYARDIYLPLLLTGAMAINGCVFLYGQKPISTAGNEYIRITQQGPQTSIIEYERKNKAGRGKTTVKLANMCHIGTKDYFKAVEEELKDCNIVFYEYVKLGDIGFWDVLFLGPFSIMPLMDGVMHHYLVLWLSGLDYQPSIMEQKKNWVCADTTMKEMYASEIPLPSIALSESFQLHKRALNLSKTAILISPLTIDKLVYSSAVSKKDYESRFRKIIFEIMMDECINMEKMESGEVKDNDAKIAYWALIKNRNDITIRMLLERLKEDERNLANSSRDAYYAIIYGAAHGPNFNNRLTKEGFKRRDIKWLTICEFDYGKKAEQDKAGRRDKPTDKSSKHRGEESNQPVAPLHQVRPMSR